MKTILEYVINQKIKQNSIDYNKIFTHDGIEYKNVNIHKIHTMDCVETKLDNIWNNLTDEEHKCIADTAQFFIDNINDTKQYIKRITVIRRSVPSTLEYRLALCVRDNADKHYRNPESIYGWVFFDNNFKNWTYFYTQSTNGNGKVIKDIEEIKQYIKGRA